MNTYGLRSINTDTFNLRWHTNYQYPQPARNTLVTFFKVHNLTLNILGYIPGVSTVSGCIRMGTGAIMLAYTLAVGDRNASEGVIIQHWYDEALQTGGVQITRGFTEAIVPFGRTANFFLDVIGTICNLGREVSNASVCQGCMGFKNHGPYPDPDYPFPVSILHIA